jgi:hypothetical protein
LHAPEKQKAARPQVVSETMSKRMRNSAPTNGRNGTGYTVGYGKPPPHGRFRPGRSGNPAGRTPGVGNLGTDVRRTLKTPVKLKEEGRSRTISTQAGVLMMLREKALNGDPRALDRLVELASRFNNEPVAAQQDLSADDRAILDSYATEIIAAHAPEITSSTRPIAAAAPRGSCASSLGFGPDENHANKRARGRRSPAAQ